MGFATNGKGCSGTLIPQPERSSCFARSASLLSRPPLSAPPLSPRLRHRPGDAAEGLAATMADFMRDGAIADLATASGRAGAISIRTAASDRGQTSGLCAAPTAGPRYSLRFISVTPPHA